MTLRAQKNGEVFNDFPTWRSQKLLPDLCYNCVTIFKLDAMKTYIIDLSVWNYVCTSQFGNIMYMVCNLQWRLKIIPCITNWKIGK